MNPFYDLVPGDSMDVVFPKGFTIEFTKHVCDNGEWKDVTMAKECIRMHSWYWDDDDHRCLDHYFYAEGEDTWFAKMYYLTAESRKKVMQFVNENYK